MRWRVKLTVNLSRHELGRIIYKELLALALLHKSIFNRTAALYHWSWTRTTMHTTKSVSKLGTCYTAASQKHILPVIIFHVAGMLHLDAVEFSISFTEWLSLIQRYSEPCSTLPSTFDQKSGVISAPTASHSTA